MMRYILLFLILTATACSGQQSSEQQTKIDTAKLFNPNPHTDEIGASEVNIFKRNIILTHPGYYILFNEKEHKLETLDKVKQFLKSNKEQIQKNKFYIITDSNTSFKKTVSIINILKEYQITNYKVIDFTPPESVTIQEPSHVETITKVNDSTYFSIEILDKGINVKLNGQEMKLKNTDELDLFVTAHKSDIKNIIITITKELPDSKIKAVFEVLKKHELNKFSLVTK